MKYTEFTVKTTAEAEDLVAEAFLRRTDYGVSVSDKADVDELLYKRSDSFDYIEEGLLDREEGVSFVKGCFPVETAEKDMEIVLNDLYEMKTASEGLIDFGPLTISSREFENDDWIKIWQETLKPIEFKRLCITPSWLDRESEKEKVIIGSYLAFGTGAHETTAFCIEFLEEIVSGGETVFDVGTGSGILGIAAAKLGAKTVLMCDNDPQAVSACENNIILNNVKDKCKVVLSDLSSEINGKADIVVANITAEILLVLLDSINDIIKEGGKLILSGILSDRVDRVVSAYEKKGFEKLSEKTTEEWRAVSFTKLRKA